MFMGMYCKIPILLCAGESGYSNGSCYYTIIVRQEKVIAIAKITNCIYTIFPTIVLCFTYKRHDKITGIELERGMGIRYGNCVTWLALT